MGPVEALDAALAQHLGAIQHAAFGAPPGGGPEWDGMLRHYRVPALDPQERAMIVSCMHLARGAVPAEVRVVFTGLQAWAQQALDQLRSNGAPPHALGALQQRVSALVDVEVAGYERALGIAPSVPMQTPVAAAAAPAGPSLASIFANANSTAKEVPWANMKQHSGVLHLSCVHCGGPQEQPQDFMCKYCRRPIAGTARPTA